MTPASIVACNIYITAASSQSSTLLSLLRRAQDQCRQLRHHQEEQQQNFDFGDFDRHTNNSNNDTTTITASGYDASSSSMDNNNKRRSRIAPVAIVHAYADIPYDRSSFHLAGRSDFVSDVASALICNALNEIDLKDCADKYTTTTTTTTSSNNSRKSGEEKKGGESTRHPFVGLVDHVSVMPILTSQHPITSNDHDDDDDDDNNSKDNLTKQCKAAAANAARVIGSRMSATNLVNVHYYGMACPENTPLATVRREQTSFFESGGAMKGVSSTKERNGTTSTTAVQQKKVAWKGDTTIGSPVVFVENFNIRLTSNVDFDRAKTLTQFLRGRNMEKRGYGVAGVEALTLPYARDTSEGGNVYEVACNLTTPKEGSADEIRSQLAKWIDRQRQELSGNRDGGGVTEDDGDAGKFNYEYFVEDAYTVGTTEEQCMRVLSGKRTEAEDIRSGTVFWEDYDKEVYHKFQDFLQ